MIPNIPQGVATGLFISQPLRLSMVLTIAYGIKSIVDDELAMAWNSSVSLHQTIRHAIII